MSEVVRRKGREEKKVYFVFKWDLEASLIYNFCMPTQ
jgi:hypothetical protein